MVRICCLLGLTQHAKPRHVLANGDRLPFDVCHRTRAFRRGQTPSVCARNAFGRRLAGPLAAHASQSPWVNPKPFRPRNNFTVPVVILFSRAHTRVVGVAVARTPIQLRRCLWKASRRAHSTGTAADRTCGSVHGGESFTSGGKRPNRGVRGRSTVSPNRQRSPARCRGSDLRRERSHRRLVDSNERRRASK